jgi:hypothetical protein
MLLGLTISVAQTHKKINTTNISFFKKRDKVLFEKLAYPVIFEEL